METKGDRRSWLRGGAERGRVAPKPRVKPFRLVLLGAPGIGKGTQAEMLYQREDDRPETIRVRLKPYETSTAPLAEFYRRRDLLVSIAADAAPEKIFERTCGALKQRI